MWLEHPITGHTMQTRSAGRSEPAEYAKLPSCIHSKYPLLRIMLQLGAYLRTSVCIMCSLLAKPMPPCSPFHAGPKQTGLGLQVLRPELSDICERMACGEMSPEQRVWHCVRVVRNTSSREA